MISMRARKLIIWLSLIFLGVPIAVALLDDISPLLDQIEWLASLLVILSLVVAGWRLKKRLKGRMEQGLGRQVGDHELTSIATWMKIPDQAGRAAREAERYDLDE